MVIDWLTPKELAKRWGWSVGSLANRRLRKRPPRFYYVGRAVMYLKSDVEKHERAHPEVFKKNYPRRSR